MNNTQRDIHRLILSQKLNLTKFLFMKTLTIETVLKAIVIAFIAFTLIAVVFEAFSDLTLLNRAF